MEVCDAENVGNSDMDDEKAFELQAREEKKPQEPLPQKESATSPGASAQAGLPSEEDELEELYESRKAAMPPPPVVRPKERRPQPADAPSRPPDPLYVRRVGQRFWSTKRILDWQRQALCAREDPEAVLKPVQEYGEQEDRETVEAGFDGHGLAGLNAECLPAEKNVAKAAALTISNLAFRRRGDATSQRARPDLSTHINTEFQTTHGNNKRRKGPTEHFQNHRQHADHENAREHAHYQNDEEHAHDEIGEQGHYENDEEHKYYQYDKNHARHKNDQEHGHYENDGGQGHYENDGEHQHYENDGEQGHYENDQEHQHYKNDGEQGHYENDGEHQHYENDGEQGHYENDQQQQHYENDGEHQHYENDQEHQHYENDGEQGHYENDGEHQHYENDGEHRHYENDEEHSNFSTHVYADLDPDFLAAQDAIQNAAAQPFYEMDIILTNEEQEQPFYKMDVTAAEDKHQQEQPFYEMNVASADENSEQVFYRMDADQLAQPARSENTYEDLDADFLAAQDAADRRHGGGEPSREAENDDSKCSQNCSKFCRSRQGRMVALCVGVIIAGIAATIIAVILTQHRVLSTDPDENMVTVNQTTLSVTSTTSSALLTVTSSQAATHETTAGTDWWGEWALYVRAYFQQYRDIAAGLEQRYPDNEVVRTLLEDRYWKLHHDLPKTLDMAVGNGIEYGISREYRMSPGYPPLGDFLSAMLDALEALRNKTEALQNKHGKMRLSLSGHVLSDADVEALANLFPFLNRMSGLHLSNCRISANAATILAGKLHLLSTLTVLRLSRNEIGDEGVAAIAETFPHLKQLQVLYLEKTSVTNLGGRVIAKWLVHLQQLQRLYLRENELALSVSELADAFANMTRLEYVNMWPVRCSTASFRMAVQQVRDAVHSLAGQVKHHRVLLLYDGSSKAVTQGLDTAWRQVEDKLTLGVYISNRQLKIDFKLLVSDAGHNPPRGFN
ncbi:hypothetical protein Bbelb_200860 [Branchiostoma belcheri]|nr:hypothetical protein Bbelb_200860 [Branchiostoma belcheri]